MPNISFTKLALVLSTLSGAMQALAKEEQLEGESPAVASVEASNQDAEVKIAAQDQVAKVFEEFARRKGENFSYGNPGPGGITYYTATEVVDAKKEDPNFASARQVAFTYAFNDILAQNIVNVYGRGQSSTATRLLDDGGAIDSAKSLAEQQQTISAKVKALAEAELDKKLTELGVDPTRYEKDIAAKQTAFLKSLNQSELKKARGSCAGISVVKTCFGRQDDGTHVIGVIAKYDPQLEAIVDCMRRKVQPNFAPKPGVPVAKFLQGDLSQEFGVHFYYDEKGAPSLLAFGQWGCPFNGNNEVRRQQQEKVAQKHAASQANIRLNEFIAGVSEFSEQNNFEAQNKVEAIVLKGGATMEQTSKNIAAFLNEELCTVASDSYKGRSELYSGIVPITGADGAKTAVSAIGWSFAQLAIAEQRIQQQRNPTADQPQQTSGYGSGVTVSQEYDF